MPPAALGDGDGRWWLLLLVGMKAKAAGDVRRWRLPLVGMKATAAGDARRRRLLLEMDVGAGGDERRWLLVERRRLLEQPLDKEIGCALSGWEYLFGADFISRP